MVRFGFPELSIGANGTTFCVLLDRDGPVGPGFQGMPEKFDFHDLFDLFFKSVLMNIVNEHGWISAFRAENDTK